MTKRLLIILAATAAAFTTGPAFGQAAAPAATTDIAPVTVQGAKRTGPWAPTESPVPVELRMRGTEICNVILQDPATRAAMEMNVGIEPRVYEATRFPRNPDWNAPPLTNPGSVFPAALTMKDYLRGGGPPQGVAGTAAFDGDETALIEGLATGGSREKAFLSCMSTGRAGANFRTPGVGLTPSGGPPPRVFVTGSGPSSADNMAMGRTQIKWRDSTLPVAFALFEHGRYEEALGQFKVAYRKLADGDGGDEAALTIGKIYLYGLKEKSDPVEAVSWLKKSADGRFASLRMMPRFDPREPQRNTAMGEAAMILADVYGKGRGAVTKDPAQARKYLERAFYLGHVEAAYVLGEIYYNGVDTPKDVKKAFDWYMKAAVFQHAEADVAVAQMYATGEAEGGPDLVKALGWYAQAAQSDHPEGLHALAVAFDKGEGAPANAQMALTFYKLAAVNGDAASQAAIGTYFYNGEGGLPRDPALARKWFERAALGGDTDGMFNLAAMQAKGEGGAVERVKAWGWLKIAEKLGHANATVAVRALEGQFDQEDRAGVEELKRVG
jgi:TPR repeat protein